MKKFISNAMAVAILTVMSQMFGYLREMLFAFYLGTSTKLEAFQVAETIPLLFTQILVSAVPLALTPLLVREQDTKSKSKLMDNGIILFGGILLIGCIAIFSFPSAFVHIVALGFHGEQFILTCRLVTILAPNIFFVSMVAVFNAFLNAKKQFVIPAAVNLILNVSIVIMQIVTKADVKFVAAGSAIGGILMFVITLTWCIVKYNFRFNFKNVDLESMRIMIIAILPVCIIASFTSINLMMDKFFASQLGNGAIATLSYSYKIINLPVYLFVTSVTKVMLPDITRLIAKSQKNDLTYLIKKVLVFCVVGGIIAVIAVQLLGSWAVGLLFGRGAFSKGDVACTTEALQIFAFGVSGMALNSFFQSVSYAGGKYFEPLKVLIVQLMIYIVIVKVFIARLGVNAIVLGNVVAINLAIVIWLIIFRYKYDVNVLKRK